MICRAVVIKQSKEIEKGTYFHVLVPDEQVAGEAMRYAVDGVIKGELRIDDGRTITAEQRKKAYATLGDISDYTGDVPEYLKEHFKYRFMIDTGADYFSFSDCSVTIAKEFITYLLNHCLLHGIPLRESLLDRTDDIDAAIYISLKHKKCVLCGKDGEVHHWDSIGMGQDRAKVDDSDMRKLCLCRKHHSEAHQIGRDSFEKKYHVYGIIFEG